METKQAFIGEYVNKAPRDRIALLMEHFGDLGSFRDNYRECMTGSSADTRKQTVNLMIDGFIMPIFKDLNCRRQQSHGISVLEKCQKWRKSKICHKAFGGCHGNKKKPIPGAADTCYESI